MTRYILVELLKVFLMTLTGLTMLIIIVLVGAEASKQGLGLGPVLRLIPYILPNALVFAVPATSLFAVCSVYGRISAANEIVALKSLGISPWQAIWPGILLAIVLSCFGVFLNDVAFSWGQNGLQRVVLQSVEEIAYGVLRTQRTYSTERFSISVKDVEGKRLIRPTISFAAGSDAPAVTIIAEEARLQSNLDHNTLSIFLTNGLFEAGDRASLAFPDTIERVIPLTEAARRGVSTSPNQIPMGKLGGVIREQKLKIRELEETHAAQATFALVTGEMPALHVFHWQQRETDVSNAKAHLNRLYTEPWRRYASGFSCLCFVCIGAPLAVLGRQSDFMWNFFKCFLPILVGYYPLFSVALSQAKAGVFPSFSVWLANLACIAVGMWLMNKVLKH